MHWVATKHVLSYFHGTVGYGLRYFLGGEVKLQGYMDSNCVGSVEDKNSMSGCCFSLGLAMISWFSKKHTFVARSTTKVEYITTNAIS